MTNVGVESVYVISDLHLGGDEGGSGKRRFQLCPPSAQERLTAFIRHLRELHSSERPAALIVNGDFIDFLAEVDSEEGDRYVPFTESGRAAVDKLDRIIRSFRGVFGQLGAFVEDGHRLVILLGNHDIELALPEVRRHLLACLGANNGGKVELIFDGEAYVSGPCLIEHGNRYDGWNAINHGELRAFRAATTRGEAATFGAPPGSRLVAELMNPLKERYGFLDLLKPENEAMIPILLALEPDVRHEITRLLPLLARAGGIEPRAGGTPTRPGYIAAQRSEPVEEQVEEQARALAFQATTRLLATASSTTSLQAVSGARSASWRDSVRGLWHALRANVTDDEGLRSLQRAFVSHRDEIKATFALKGEAPKYLLAAERLHKDHRVVTFGHTHIAKFIPLDRGAYVNTGTWCPTLALPPALYEGEGEDPEQLELLRAFIRDLQADHYESWTQLRTFALRIEPNGDAMRVGLVEWLGSGDLAVRDEVAS